MSTKWIECFYGQSGSGKSESIVALILRIFNETGRTSRIVIGDGSGATYAALVGAGIVEMADYSIKDWPLSTMTQFCEGYWPENVEDPKSKMLPMTPDKAKTIGLYAIEGLSVVANYVMGDKKGGFAEQAGRGIKIGQDSPIMLVDLERDKAGNYLPNTGPGMVFGGNSLAHYGAAQKRVLGFVEKSKALPGSYLIWTAHEKTAEDKITGQKLNGPEVAGGALTANLSRYFNNTLHFATAEKTKKEKDDHTDKSIDVIDAEYRIYTKDHFRAEGNTFVKYKAVCRHPDPGGNLYPGTKPLPGYFESNKPGQSLLEIYEHIATARQCQIAALPKAA